MKPNKIITVLLLAIVLSSNAIQIKHNNLLNKAKAQRSASSYDALWGEIVDLYRKEDLNFSLGGVLKLSDKIQFPFSVTLFPNDRGEWDWTYSPKGTKEVNDATKEFSPEDIKAAVDKFSGATLFELIFDAAGDAAISFVKDLVEKLSRSSIVAIYPQIIPLFAAWMLRKEAGVQAFKDQSSGNEKIRYNICYTYDVMSKYLVPLTLYVQLTLNFSKIKTLFTKFTITLYQYCNSQFNTFVPQKIRGPIGGVRSGPRNIQSELQNFANGLKEGSFESKVAPNQSVLFEHIKKNKVGNWTLSNIQVLGAEDDGKWAVNKIMATSFKKLSSALSTIDKNAAVAMKESYNNSKDWISNAANKVLEWFFSFGRRRVSYRMLLRLANRRYFNRLKRAPKPQRP